MDRITGFAGLTGSMRISSLRGNCSSSYPVDPENPVIPSL
jgi:hypothetical protein